MSAIYRYDLGSDTREPSRGLWQHCEGDIGDPSWVGFHEDFEDWDQTAGAGKFMSLVVGNSGSAALTTDEVGGVVAIATGSTIDDEATLVSGDNTAGFCKFSAGLKVFFEARIKVAAITNTYGFFCGLAEEALGGTLFSGSDVMESKDYVGWRVVGADGDIIEPVYLTAAGTEAVIKADAVTLVADTYVKLGFGMWRDDQVAWFHNGAQIASCDVTHPVAIGTSGFPDGEEMAAYAGIHTLANAAKTAEIDWVRCLAQVEA